MGILIVGSMLALLIGSLVYAYKEGIIDGPYAAIVLFVLLVLIAGRL